MIISHRYKYVFIEIPVTGSYAIRQELCKYYAGQPILHKHATYPEFLQIASEEEKQYFSFASVRNPLDTLVSVFFKFKTNHKDAYSDPLASIASHKIDYADVQQYQRISKTDTTFEADFMQPRLWERPYSNMIEVSSDHLNFVIRYERLNEDFAEVLRRLGIEQVRPIPSVNKTQGKESNWECYYTPRMRDRAKRITGPFMQKWGYTFPESWGDHQVAWHKQVEFRLVNGMKKFYLLYFRYSNKGYATVVRKLNAQLKRAF